MIDNWFSNSSAQLSQISTGDGYALAANQVQQLVSAMAGFTPPSSGQTALTGAEQTALAPVIAAAWHGS
jgi:hypothetical protein